MNEIEQHEALNKALLDELAADYQALYGRLELVKEIEARASATTSLMISLHGLKDYRAAAKARCKAAMEAQVQPDTKPAPATENAAATPTAPPAGPVNAPSGARFVPPKETTAAPPAPPELPKGALDNVPRDFNGKPIPPFDTIKNVWNFCPICFSNKIVHTKDGKDWYGCFDCQIFLNIVEGAPVKKPMHPKKV